MIPCFDGRPQQGRCTMALLEDALCQTAARHGTPTMGTKWVLFCDMAVLASYTLEAFIAETGRPLGFQLSSKNRYRRAHCANAWGYIRRTVESLEWINRK